MTHLRKLSISFTGSFSKMSILNCQFSEVSNFFKWPVSDSLLAYRRRLGGYLDYWLHFKPWLRRTAQLLKLAATCTSTVLLTLWTFVGIMQNYSEKTPYTTTLKFLVRFRTQLETLDQPPQQELIKCGSMRQPVAIRLLPEKMSMEQERSAYKLWSQKIQFVCSYINFEIANLLKRHDYYNKVIRVPGRFHRKKCWIIDLPRSRCYCDYWRWENLSINLDLITTWLDFYT